MPTIIECLEEAERCLDFDARKEISSDKAFRIEFAKTMIKPALEALKTLELRQIPKSLWDVFPEFNESYYEYSCGVSASGKVNPNNWGNHRYEYYQRLSTRMIWTPTNGCSLPYIYRRPKYLFQDK